MFSTHASPGEIAGVVIIVVIFLALGIFVCGCSPLPEPSEVGMARWRARKERAAARLAERRANRENQLPLHRTPSQTRNRRIMFADEKATQGNSAPPAAAVQAPLPSPPPPTVARIRSPSPQMAVVRSRDSDCTSVSSRISSISDAHSMRSAYQAEKGGTEQPDEKSESSSSLSSDKNVLPPGITTPPPVYSNASKNRSADHQDS